MNKLLALFWFVTTPQFLSKVAVAGLLGSTVVLGHETSTLKLFYAITLASVALYVVVRGRGIIDSIAHYLASPLMRWRWAFLFWTACSLFWVVRGAEASIRVITITQIYLLGWILYDAVRFRNMKNFVLGVLFFSAAIGALTALYMNIRMFDFRARGLYGNPNVLAMNSLYGLAAFFGVAGAWKSRTLKVIGDAIAVVMTSAIVISASRKGLLGLPLVWGAGVAFRASRARSFVQLGVVGAALVGILVLMPAMGQRNILFSFQRIQEGIQTLSGDVSTDRSAMKRIEYLTKGAAILAEKPIIGHGLESFRWLSDLETYSHNNYLELAVSLGLVGVCLYYALFCAAFYRSVSETRFGRGNYQFNIIFLLLLAAFDFAAVTYYSKLSNLIVIYCVATLDAGDENA